MAYATVSDIEARLQRLLTDSERITCERLLEDAAIIIDTFNAKAKEEVKKIVSCGMVLRAIGQTNDLQVPIGTTQATVSALGYSQTFTMGNGSAGEMYLSKLEKKLLGSGKKLGFISPWENET